MTHKKRISRWDWINKTGPDRLFILIYIFVFRDKKIYQINICYLKTMINYGIEKCDFEWVWLNNMIVIE